MGLLLIKTQPHGADLLAKANRRAVDVLKHGLRELPKAEKLRHACPRPTLHERLGKYTQSAGVPLTAYLFFLECLTRKG